MESKLTITQCDTCARTTIVFKELIQYATIIECTECAKAPISVFEPDNGIVIGAIEEQSLTTTRCKDCGIPVSSLHMYCSDCAPDF